jgi:hypothetical protein
MLALHRMHRSHIILVHALFHFLIPGNHMATSSSSTHAMLNAEAPYPSQANVFLNSRQNVVSLNHISPLHHCNFWHHQNPAKNVGLNSFYH